MITNQPTLRWGEIQIYSLLEDSNKDNQNNDRSSSNFPIPLIKNRKYVFIEGRHNWRVCLIIYSGEI